MSADAVHGADYECDHPDLDAEKHRRKRRPADVNVEIEPRKGQHQDETRQHEA